MVNPLHLAIFHNNLPLVQYFCNDLHINLKKSMAIDFDVILQPKSRSTPLRDINNFTDKYSDFQFSKVASEVSDLTPAGKNGTETSHEAIEQGRYPLIVFLVYCYLNLGYDSKMIMYFWTEFGQEIFNEHDLMFITKIGLKNRQHELIKEIYASINTVRIIKSLPFERRVKFLRHSIIPENKANVSAAKSTSSQSSYNYSLNFTQEVDKANMEAKTFLESPFLQYLA